MKKFVNSALKTALYLLELSDQASDRARDRIADRYEDVRDQARDSYGVMADRVNNATRALRGEDNSAARSVLMFVGGVSAVLHGAPITSRSGSCALARVLPILRQAL